MQERGRRVEELQGEVQAKDELIAAKDGLMAIKDDLVTRKDREIVTKEADISRLRETSKSQLEVQHEPPLDCTK